MALTELTERVMEWLEHSLWRPCDELAQQEPRELRLLQVRELLGVWKTKMKTQVSFWALELLGSTVEYYRLE